MEERELLSLLSQDSAFTVAAHELKAPLSVIRQLSLTLCDDDLEISNSDRKRILHQISLTSERTLRLSTDLTKVSRLKDAMFEMSPVNVRRICEDVFFEMSDIATISDREIRIKIKKGDLVFANYSLLRSVLLNFIDNAIYCSSKKTKIELSAKNLGEKIQISVRDYGESLPTSIWRMVKKENRPVNSASRPQSSGLGIFIAKNFAEAMGGKIGVIRHKNGNTFFVELNKSGQLSLFE